MGNITFLGVEGSGKTVLTMALVNAFKAHLDDGWFLRPETQGAFRFLEMVPKAVSGDSLPHQTVALRHLAWSVTKNSEPQRTFDVLDYPGEAYRYAFLDAKDALESPEDFQEHVEAHREDIDALLHHLMESDQVFVLFNPEDGKDLSQNSRNLDAVWVTNACLNWLHRLEPRPRITLLLTQIDRYVDLETHEFNPGAYVAHHLPLIAQNFPELDVAAVAALGPTEAHFGIDGILLRCLIDVPAVQLPLARVERLHASLEQQWERWLGTFKAEDLRTLGGMLPDYAAAVAALKRAWFYPVDDLAEQGQAPFHSHQALDELTELGTFIQRRLGNLSEVSAKDRLRRLSTVSGRLQDVGLFCMEGEAWRQETIQALRVAIESCQNQISVQAGLWWALGALGVGLLLAYLIVLSAA